MSPGFPGSGRARPTRVHAAACVLACIAFGACAQEPPLRCSYYLFEARASVTGCSDCTVPLLVTAWPLEARRTQAAVVVTTYERDSVSSTRRTTLDPAALALEVDSRRLTLDGRTYRYQQVPNAETARLLADPVGRIPIHRIPPTREDHEAWTSLRGRFDAAATCPAAPV